VLLEHGHSVVLIDNLSNSFERVFQHMKKLAGDKADKMKFVQVGGSSNSRWCGKPARQ
jgi:UDP-glucose 4-epimerase